jgi:hypothetical protein
MRLSPACPVTIKRGTTVITMSIGSAKLTPLPLPEPCLLNVAVLTPTMRPELSSNGPPEFPAGHLQDFSSTS